MKKLFELHQKITFLVNEYVILKDASATDQKVVGYAKQKRLALREEFKLFKDESQKEVLASSKARSVIDFAPTFDVYDASGKPLAVLKKEFKKSLLVSSWNIYDAKMQKVLFTISEKDKTVAILRRLWNFIPFIAEFPFPLKFHFDISSGNKSVGQYTKITLVRDHYALYLNDDQLKKTEERTWMVMAVLLDAMQSR